MTLAEAEAIYRQHAGMFKRQERPPFVLFEYHYALWEVFRDTPRARELRGIIFDLRDGALVSLPFHKFFNLNENEEVNEARLELGGVLMHKEDGSMVQLSAHQNEVVVASRSSLSGYVKREVETLLSAQPELRTAVLAEPDYTFLFELLDPQARVVLEHSRKELVFLNARSKRDGRYHFARFTELPVRTVPHRRIAPGEWPAIRAELAERENFEGYVLQLASGVLVKVKTPWYVRHHSLVTGLSAKGVVQAWAAGNLDDLVASLRGLERHDIVAEITDVLSRVDALLTHRVATLVELARPLETPKVVALALQPRLEGPLDGIIFALLMRGLRQGGLEPHAIALEVRRQLVVEAKAKLVLEAVGVKELHSSWGVGMSS